jgi:hypothetical protein
MGPLEVGLLVLVVVVPAVICGIKGKPGMLAAGILLTPVFSIIGAIRLAMPDSYWARKWYGDDELRRSWERHNTTPYAQPSA